MRARRLGSIFVIAALALAQASTRAAETTPEVGGPDSMPVIRPPAKPGTEAK